MTDAVTSLDVAIESGLRWRPAAVVVFVMHIVYAVANLTFFAAVVVKRVRDRSRGSAFVRAHAAHQISFGNTFHVKHS